jgi:hypothetical protein
MDYFEVRALFYTPECAIVNVYIELSKHREEFGMYNAARSITGGTLVALALTLNAAADRPEAAQKSPWQHVEQQVGNTFIEMEFSRPGVRGREVYGTDLVPYDGRVWRAGANERTSITFDSDVTVNGKPLEAGTYGLLILATKDEWTFIFSANFMSHGSEEYDPKDDALRVTAKPQAAEHQEWMVYEFNGLTDNSVQIDLHWEKIRCGVEVKVSDS